MENHCFVESDASVKSFHEKKIEQGFDQLLSLETFNDASNGYLFNDGCVFGAEIFVIKPAGKGELLSMVKKPANGSLTWKIEDFSKLDKSSYLSKAFTARGRSWRIQVYPKGYGDGKGNSLSVYLELVDGGKLPPKKTVWAEYKLRVLNQQPHGKHVEEKTSRWLTSSSYTRGFPKFMPLGDLRDVSKGYVKSDTLIVEAEILTLSVPSFSHTEIVTLLFVSIINLSVLLLSDLSMKNHALISIKDTAEMDSVHPFLFVVVNVP